MQAAEVELKFPVPAPQAFPALAQDAGFTLDTPRTFESNTLYDTAGRSLRAQKQILRIRTYGMRSVLTHKRVADPAADAGSPFKTRIETETEIEDPAALAEVFTQLGFGPVFRYEKYRTEWSRGGGHLVLDETPIGVWAELEGDPAWIGAMLERLGVDRSTCSRESYGTLFLDWKKCTGNPAENLTFDEVAPAAV